MIAGFGVGINRQRFSGGFADSYSSRVLADGGTIESLSCVSSASTLLQQASLLLIPSGYKAGTAYSALPNNGNGDLTWSRNSTANRTNSSGVIESVGANVPRLSYMYGSCPAALLEPQRTNSILRSEEFDNAIWSKSGVTLTANAITAPDGALTADRVQNGSIFQNVTFTNGTVYTASIWIRGTANGTTVIGTSSGAVFQSVSITTDWQRYSFTRTYSGSGEGLCVFIGSGSVKDIYIWGAQLEVGAYATTYIPTTSATATRLADAFTRNNIYTNGLISASGGTWYIQFRVTATERDNNSTLSIGEVNNALRIVSGLLGYTFIVSKIIAGTGTNLYFGFTGSASFIKLAIKWNGTTADVYLNGTKVVSATSFTITNLSDLMGELGSPMFIKEMALFPSPLSDTDCQTLTT